MALAILEFIVFEKGNARFRIDTGTNPYYRIKIGRSVSETNEIKWVDEVTHTTPVRSLGTTNYLLNTRKEIALPASYFDRDNCYVQLFSFKNSAGKSPAFSKVIKVPVGFKNVMHGDYLLSLSLNTNNMTSTDFNDCRFVDGAPGISKYSGQQSFGDILNVIKVLAPVVQEVLSAAQNGSGNNTNGPSQNALTSLLPAGSWNTILNALLHGLSAVTTASTPASAAKSLSLEGNDNDNRFADGSNSNYSQPFIFGIDDALLASLAGSVAGPLLQALPQLLTAYNQQKLQKQAANNKLITDLIADTNKRRILEQLLQNQTDQSNAAKAQLAQLLQQASAAANADPAPATASSLSIDRLGSSAYATVLSTSTVVSFDTGNLSDWNGVKRTIYSKNGPIALKIKLNAPDPAPKNPLPKAIIKFYFKEAEGAKPMLEKTFRQKNVPANTLLQFLFTKEEIAALPPNKNLMVFAEIRWLTKSGKEIKALGSMEAVFVTTYFLKEQGKPASEERELADMKTYRAFWNKIWEAPVLDAVNNKGDDKKYLWELNATLKYSFTLTAEHDSNGLMPTKMLKGPADKESVSEKQEGRMKAGMELSINELNKLCSLWDKQPILPDEKRDALKNALFIKNNASEFIYNAKLKGKAGLRGMIWVAPVFKLFNCKLNKVKTTNESGQVTEVEEETIQFPLPVSARIIGLKSA